MVDDIVESWRIENGESWVGIRAVQALLISIDPGYVSFIAPLLHRRKANHMVFQLNWPSYSMLRLYGLLVKSTASSVSSRSGKKSSNDGAWSEMVVKSSPVRVMWLRNSFCCNNISPLLVFPLCSPYIIVAIDLDVSLAISGNCEAGGQSDLRDLVLHNFTIFELDQRP